MSAVSPLGVLACFEQLAPAQTLPELSRVFPWYCKACLGVILPDGIAVYGCTGRLDEEISTFSKCMYPWGTIQSSDFGVRNHMLLLDISVEECVKIQNTCEACVRAKLGYNTYDALMSLVPFRCPEDLSIFQVQSVRNVQATVLIVRECVDPASNTTGTALKDLNSRTIRPTDLYNILKPLSTEFRPSEWKHIVPEQDPPGAPLIIPKQKPRRTKPADDWW
jgi:hypothetical protein